MVTMLKEEFNLKVFIWKIIEYVVCYSKWLIFHFSNRRSDSAACLVGQTSIVTGGCSGIGLAVATQLASRGGTVILADKVLSEEAKNRIVDRTGNPNIILKYLDLSSFQSIREFAEDIKKTEAKIDILINNAGIGASSRICAEEGVNYVMQINFFGAFLLTHLLLDQLKASRGARIVFTSSMLAFIHSLSLKTLNPTDYDDQTSMNRLLYANSKLCNILAAQGFAEKLKSYGIYVFSVDPGTTRTPIYRNYGKGLPGGWLRKLGLEFILLFGTDVDMAAQSSFHVASQSKYRLKNGHHYFRCRPFTKPWICYDQKICDEIWRKSEEIVRLRPEEKISEDR